MTNPISDLLPLALCVLVNARAECGPQATSSKQALEDLKQAGAKVTLDPNGAVHVDLAARVSKEALAALKKVTNLRSLDLSGTGVRDETLELLKDLTELQSLNLSTNHFTDPGLKHLNGLAKLTSLNLNYNNGLTNPGLKNPGPHRSFKILN